MEASEALEAAGDGQTSILDYAQKAVKFENRTLNQMIGMWVVRTAQPWARIEDPFLRACFRFANPQVQLFGRTWLATFAHKAYLDLRKSVMDELKVSSFIWYLYCFTLRFS